MKRKLIVILLLFLIITGCGKKEESNGNFSISCIGEKDNSTGVETQNKVVYLFNKDQYAFSYLVETTQKFNDKSVYDTYKKAQEETKNNNKDEKISYDLKYDDKEMTLVFTMTIHELDKDTTTEEEKASLKASDILKKNEDRNLTCEINGINRNLIK